MHPPGQPCPLPAWATPQSRSRCPRERQSPPSTRRTSSWLAWMHSAMLCYAVLYCVLCYELAGRCCSERVRERERAPSWSDKGCGMAMGWKQQTIRHADRRKGRQGNDMLAMRQDHAQQKGKTSEVLPGTLLLQQKVSGVPSVKTGWILCIIQRGRGRLQPNACLP